jgi:hypothetical protein
MVAVDSQGILKVPLTEARRRSRKAVGGQIRTVQKVPSHGAEIKPRVRTFASAPAVASHARERGATPGLSGCREVRGARKRAKRKPAAITEQHKTGAPRHRGWAAEVNCVLRRTGDPEAARRAGAALVMAAIDCDASTASHVAKARGRDAPPITLSRAARRRDTNDTGEGDRIVDALVNDETPNWNDR